MRRSPRIPRLQAELCVLCVASVDRSPRSKVGYTIVGSLCTRCKVLFPSVDSYYSTRPSDLVTTITHFPQIKIDMDQRFRTVRTMLVNRFYSRNQTTGADAILGTAGNTGISLAVDGWPAAIAVCRASILLDSEESLRNVLFGCRIATEYLVRDPWTHPTAQQANRTDLRFRQPVQSILLVSEDAASRGPSTGRERATESLASQSWANACRTLVSQPESRLTQRRLTHRRARYCREPVIRLRLRKSRSIDDTRISPIPESTSGF